MSFNKMLEKNLEKEEDSIEAIRKNLENEDELHKEIKNRLDEELKLLEEFQFENEEEEEKKDWKKIKKDGKTENRRRGIIEYREKCKLFDFLTFPVETVVSKFDENCEFLELRHLGLGDQGLEAISEMVKVNETISILSLDDNNITPVGFRFLVKALKSNTTSRIHTITLRNNQLGVKQKNYRFGPVFIELIESKPKSLEAVNLQGNYLSDPDVIDIAKVLVKQGTIIKKLDLSYNNIGHSSASALRTLFDNNVNISEISFEWNSFNQSSMLELIQGLKKDNTLKKLNLAWCGITDVGAREIAKMLLGNGSLEVLDLRNNRISIPGAIAIAKALPEATCVELYLSNNPIQLSGALVLLDSMQKTDRLDTIQLDNIDVGWKYQKVLENVQKKVKEDRKNLKSIREIEQEVLLDLCERLNWKKKLVDPALKEKLLSERKKKLEEEQRLKQEEDEKNKNKGKSTTSARGKKKNKKKKKSARKKQEKPVTKPYYVLV